MNEGPLANNDEIVDEEAPPRSLEQAMPSFDRLPVALPISKQTEERIVGFFNGSFVRRRLFWLLHALVRHHSLRTANAMAFDFFLALIPMLGLAGWVLANWLQESASVAIATSLLVDLTPYQLHSMLRSYFESLAARELAPFAVLLGWWLSSSAFYTLISVFEETFDCDARTWIHGRLVSLGFAALGLLILSLVSIASFLWTLLLLPESGFADARHSPLLTGLLKYCVIPATLFGVMAFLAFIYRFSIRRPKYKRKVWPGAIFAVLVGALASLILGYYVSNIARYALFYGSLATIVVLHLWLWLWCTAVVTGAEINIALEDLKKTGHLPSRKKKKKKRSPA